MRQAPRTFQDQFLASGKRPSGFDYMRLVLAVSIICYHSVTTCYGMNGVDAFLQNPAARLWNVTLVPMFFALSGFLVAGSLARTRTVVSFLGLRVLRIVPALGAEIFLSAVVLGSIFTVLPLNAYFSSSGFHAYFLNVLGDIHFYLPGVFVHNPVTRVNGQLWTIPAELACYVTLAILFVAGVVARPRLLAGGFVVAQVVLPAVAVILMAKGIAVPAQLGWPLVLMFVAGLLMFIYRAEIPWRRDLAMASFALCAAIAIVAPGIPALMTIPLAYLTAYLGLLNPPRIRLIESGDYSYGLYLYGYPIQQAVVASGLIPLVWWANIAVSLPLAFCFAAASWHLLEKHVLKLKAPLIALEGRMMTAISRQTPPPRPAPQGS